MQLSKERWYWLAQAAGWSLYGLMVWAYNHLYVDYNNYARLPVSVAVLCIGGFLLTHGFRHLLIRRQWLDLPIALQALNIAVAVVVMGALLTALNLLAEWLMGNRPLGNWNLMVLLVNFLPTVSLFLFWTLAYLAVHYFRTYKREEIERLRWESSLKDFELNKLKSQLNPHFVFNALNSIRALVRQNPEKAEECINRLSRILRQSLLSDRNRTIPLSEEMATVRDYLALEQIRYEERLQYREDIPTEALHCQVPPMMVQTLVENAVKHGIAKQVGGGTVELVATLNHQLTLILRNEGQLKQQMGSGFGLSNTRQRLQLLYGERAQFHIGQESPSCVKAQLQLPLHNA